MRTHAHCFPSLSRVERGCLPPFLPPPLPEKIRFPFLGLFSLKVQPEIATRAFPSSSADENEDVINLGTFLSLRAAVSQSLLPPPEKLVSLFSIISQACSCSVVVVIPRRIRPTYGRHKSPITGRGFSICRCLSACIYTSSYQGGKASFYCIHCAYARVSCSTGRKKGESDVDESPKRNFTFKDHTSDGRDVEVAPHAWMVGHHFTGERERDTPRPSKIMQSNCYSRLNSETRGV